MIYFSPLNINIIKLQVCRWSWGLVERRFERLSVVNNLLKSQDQKIKQY
jgi:hypothetical protein